MKLRKAQIFLGNESNIAVHIFFIQQEENTTTIQPKRLDIIFPGLPQTPYFSDITKLVDKDRAIAYFHYPGSWYSGGHFNPSEIHNSITQALQSFETGEFNDIYTEEKLTIKAENVSLIGNSFGGYFVFTAATKHPKILLSPFLPSCKATNKNEEYTRVTDKVASDLTAYRKSLPYCYKGITDSSWSQFPYSQYTGPYDIPEIYIGNLDSLITKDYVMAITGEKSNIKTIECGHDFLELYKAYVKDTRG